jgi:hypothetical protein
MEQEVAGVKLNPALSKLHSFATQNTAVFRGTAMRISNPRS